MAWALLSAPAGFIVPGAAQASTDAPRPSATSFAYPVSHGVRPLPDEVIEKIADYDGDALGGDVEIPGAVNAPIDARVGPFRQWSRKGLCSAVASVARANNLPIPFFANLIWQESNFNSKVISRAGAQGIAQFMPKTAVEFGLINPFEPLHALNVAGKFVSELHAQFGNLGLAAAAYNAGGRRVSDWMANRGRLPGETRNYVLKITGRPADQWVSPETRNDPEATLMPAQAPCVEVAEAVKAQAKVVRLAKLMTELAAAAAQARESDAEDAPKAGVAVVADARWAVRARVMVDSMLKKFGDKIGSKALAKAEDKATVKSAIKLAVLDPPRPDASKAAAKKDAAPPARRAAKSADKGRASASAEPKDADNRASRKSRDAKTAKSRTAKSRTAQSGSEKSGAGQAASGKSEATKSEAAKRDGRKRHRASRRTAASYSNNDRIF